MKQKLLNDDDHVIISTLRLISSETNYKILKLIYNSKERMNITDISNKLQKTSALISNNVKKLEEVELIKATYESKKDKHGISKFVHINKKNVILNKFLSYLKIND